MVEVEQWSVFRRGKSGGNPCPVITDANGLRPAQMQAIAAHYGHESVFVTSVEASGVGLRYFVPRHPDGDRQHVVARQFPVDAGYPEDPATGVAAAALAAYLADGLRPAQPAWTRIVIDQGDAMGQPSSLLAAALAGPAGTTRTCVTGQAIRINRDQLDVSAITRGQDLPEPELLLFQNGLLSRPAKRRRSRPDVCLAVPAAPRPCCPSRPCCPTRRYCVRFTRNGRRVGQQGGPAMQGDRAMQGDISGMSLLGHIMKYWRLR